VVSFGLLSRDESTRGVAVVGVDPRREPRVTTLAQRVREGTFLTAGGRREMVLGERLARAMRAGIGDRLLLYSFAYSLETAYDFFRVVGVMKLPDPQLDRSLAVISLADAQEFFVYGDRVSEIAVLAKNADATPSVRDALARALPPEPPAEVYTWQRAMPELEQLVFLDDAGMYILLVILIVVVAFGILNTLMMAVLERRREFGVCLALGLRPSSVFRIVYWESLLLALVGLAIGLPVGIALVLWFQAHPIELVGQMGEAMALFGVEPVMMWKLKPLNPIGSTVTILGVALVAALYPAFRASRGRPVDVLRSL
jgi:ABC-type lipoprotein release transport system permease subunit